MAKEEGIYTDLSIALICAKHYLSLQGKGRIEYEQTIKDDVLPMIEGNPQARKILEGVVSGDYDFLNRFTAV